MASVGRQRHLFFRMKGGSRDVVKVFTNLRLPGLKGPHQVHICYLKRSTALDASAQMVVTRKLNAAWVHLFPNEQVEVDWPKALAMWERVGVPKAHRIDRARALHQIMQWCTQDEQFARLHHQRIPERLSHQIGATHDDAVINWWLLEELPRLFYSFERRVERSQGTSVEGAVSAQAFTNYILAHFRRGWPVADYRRRGQK